MTANSENRVAKLSDFTAAPRSKTCYWDPIAARVEDLEMWMQPWARGCGGARKRSDDHMAPWL